MKQTLRTIGYKVIAAAILLSFAFIICAALAGPLMIGWNFSFGLFIGSVTYVKCLKIIIGIVASVGTIGAILNILSKEKNDNG